jgi:ACS family hexuronate transporter-like MFS transporter
VLGPVVVVAIAKAWGWRAAFYLVGAPGLLCALLIALFLREPGRQPPVPVSTPSAPEASPTPPPADTRNLGLFEMLRIRNVWLCCVIGIFLGGWLLLNGVFLPLYFTKLRHFSPTTMSLLLAAMGAAGAFYGFLAPTLSDRFGRKPIMVAFSAIAAIAPLAALLFRGPLPILGLLLFAGFTGNGLFPLFMGTIPGEALPPRYAATAMGLIVCVTEIVGGFVLSFVAGRVADATSLAAPSIMAIACALTAALLSLGLKESAPAKLSPAIS